MITTLVTNFIEDHLVMAGFGYGYYNGIKDPTVSDLLQLKAYIEFALATATKEDLEDA